MWKCLLDFIGNLSLRARKKHVCKLSAYSRHLTFWVQACWALGISEHPHRQTQRRPEYHRLSFHLHVRFCTRRQIYCRHGSQFPRNISSGRFVKKERKNINIYFVQCLFISACFGVYNKSMYILYVHIQYWNATYGGYSYRACNIANKHHARAIIIHISYLDFNSTCRLTKNINFGLSKVVAKHLADPH